MFTVKQLPYFLAISVILGLLLSGCNFFSDGNETDNDSTEREVEEELKYGQVVVDNLRMRDGSGLGGNEITQIGKGQYVRLTGKKSDTTETISIRGLNKPHYWHEIIFNGDTGWIYGGGMEILESDELTIAGRVKDFIIEPGIRAGIVTKESTHEELVSQMGPGEVIKDKLHLGGEETVEGTILYPNSNNELKIYWKNQDFENIQQVIISKPGAQWQTKSGIHIGQSIQEVTAINGTPFELTGFQWDLAGTTLNWQGGDLNPKLTLSFDYHGDISVYPFLIGDKVISSDNSSLLKLEPRVRQILVSITE
ncbi:hypothetical protein KUV50_03100 [Membranicola marinus]|uniref:SH3b domain-containing protein n=1 Tax=Membranihabitans marinus TaxID=1227546 RepID=A0A953HSI6_9BACT|nr:hypothetical protein [Membranihabitans marinus]MBY5957108.1 hypothetical protein [Membranihabitans marinus]